MPSPRVPARAGRPPGLLRLVCGLSWLRWYCLSRRLQLVWLLRLLLQ
jgi:hypothetical protein